MAAPVAVSTERTAVELGMRRISMVRVILDGPSVRASVVGIGNRLPVERSIPLSLASALIAAGAPSVIRHVPEGD